jgi:ribosomal protein S3
MTSPLTLDLYTLIVIALKMSAQISKKRKFVADGVFRAELSEFFTRELAEEGYSGCDVRVTHARTEVLH